MLKTIRRSRRFTLEVMPVSTLVLAGLAGCGGEGARTPDPSTDPTSRLKHTGVGAFEDFPDGTYGAYRIREGSTWQLTNTFSF